MKLNSSRAALLVQSDENTNITNISILKIGIIGRLSIFLFGSFYFGLGNLRIMKVIDDIQIPTTWEYFQDCDGQRYFRIKNTSFKKRIQILSEEKTEYVLDGYLAVPVI